MRAASITVGTIPVLVPYPYSAQLGMRLLARTANSGAVYLGTTAAVTTATGVLLPKGDPGASLPFVVPPGHFTGGTVFLVADAVSQVVDWSAE